MRYLLKKEFSFWNKIEQRRESENIRIQWKHTSFKLIGFQVHVTIQQQHKKKPTMSEKDAIKIVI